MLSGCRSSFLTLRSIPSRYLRCVTIATASRRLPYMGLRPEKTIASAENQYYRLQFEKKQPAITVLVPEVPVVVQKLEEMNKDGESIEMPKYDDVAKELAQQLSQMSGETVIYVLDLLAHGFKDPRKFDNRNTLWSAIDSVLVRSHKAAERSLNNLLNSLDHALLLCMANPGRIPNLAINLSGSFVKRLKNMELDKQKLLKLLFILNLSRNPVPASVARDLENRVLITIDDMTFEEVGLVCAAFFKTQTKISSAVLITKVVEKATIKENRTPDKAMAMSSILKMLKYQVVFETVANVRNFIDSFTKDELMQMTPMAINHLCRLTAAYHKYSPIILASAVENLSANIQAGAYRVRFKDVVETLRSCDDFGYSADPALMNQIIAGWPSPEEIFHYPNIFITYLSLLASLGHYPETLIEKCFSYKFLQHAKERCNPFPYIPLLSLHTMLSIDCYPKFNGNLLRDEEVDDAVRRIGRADMGLVMDKRSQPETFTATYMKRLFWRCKDKFGQRIAYAFILPYVRLPEIILLGKGQDVAWLKTRKLVPGAFDGCTCISLDTRQYYADSETTMPRNFSLRKKQLLQKLGLRIFTFNFADMNHVSNSLMDQQLNKVE